MITHLKVLTEGPAKAPRSTAPGSMSRDAWLTIGGILTACAVQERLSQGSFWRFWLSGCSGCSGAVLAGWEGWEVWEGVD